MIPFRAFAFVSLLAWSASAAVGQEAPKGGIHELEVQGEGTTRARAIGSGLHSAVLQVFGGRVEGSEDTKSQLEQIVSNAGSDVKEALQATQEIRQATKGFVRGYEVLDAKEDKDGLWVAKLRVRVLQFDPDDPRGGERPALAVLGFDVRDGAPVRTRDLDVARVRDELRDRVTARAAESGVFVTITREQLAQVEAEHRFSESDATGPLEAARVGMMLGADFLLRGTIHEFVVEDVNVQVGGIPMQSERASARVGLEIVNVATGATVAIPSASVGWRTVDLDRDAKLRARRLQSPSPEHLLMDLAVDQVAREIAQRFEAAPWMRRARPEPRGAAKDDGMTPFERALLQRLDAIERRLEALERELRKG